MKVRSLLRQDCARRAVYAVISVQVDEPILRPYAHPFYLFSHDTERVSDDECNHGMWSDANVYAN